MEEKEIKRVLNAIETECGFFLTAKKQKEIIRAIKRLKHEDKNKFDALGG